MYIDYYDSPIGLLKVTATDMDIQAVSYETSRIDTISNNTVTKNCIKQLNEYFNGSRTIFDISIDFIGTPFQKSIWNVLLEIPYGKSVSYSDVSHIIHNEKAIRAVGTAIGRNPVAIIVPCHRVIGKDKTLTGYAGGLDKKKYLLDLEHITYL